MTTSSRQRKWALRTHGWAAQQNEEEVLLWSEELGANMWQSLSVSNSPLTHNQHQPFRNPFENKVWEVYFSKEVCSFVIIFDYASACICIRIVVSWLCNNKIVYCHIQDTRWVGVLSLSKDSVGVFYSPSRLG